MTKFTVNGRFWDSVSIHERRDTGTRTSPCRYCHCLLQYRAFRALVNGRAIIVVLLGYRSRRYILTKSVRELTGRTRPALTFTRSVRFPAVIIVVVRYQAELLFLLIKVEFVVYSFILVKVFFLVDV